MSDPNQKQRVVVTGLGCVSSLGIGWQELWQNLIAGKSGISPVEYFDTSGYDRHNAGEVKNFDYRKYTRNRLLGKMGRSTQMAYVAAKLALEDAGLYLKDIKGNSKVGLSIGTTMGEPQFMEIINRDCIFQKKKITYDAKSSLFYPASTIAGNLSYLFSLRNRSIVFANACSSGNFTVGQGFDWIKKGTLDYAIVGGSDALSRIAFNGFSRIFAVAPEMCQPFDKNRQGMIPGEGAAFLILESLESAQKRKAGIYAEILGHGTSSDAYDMTHPRYQGIVKALRKALKNSNTESEQIDYISAHGTGTIENDKAECQAYQEVFGKRFKIPVSSIKSMLGHTMGASSAFESIACCLVLKEGIIPPTINHQEDDSECPINCIPNKSIKKSNKIVLNNSQAFGGSNFCLVLRGLE